MNLTTESFYFYYMLQFMDGETKVFSSIEETFCSQSIRERKLNLFQNSYEKSYQLFCTNDHCVIKPLINTGENFINESQWIQTLIKYHFEDFTRHQINITFKVSNEKKYENLNIEKFYLKKVYFRMKLQLFDKITCNPLNYHKIYSSQEIFYICHSNAFHIFDNQSTILANIVYLIYKRKLHINDIYQEFINYISQHHKNSKYFEKFIDQMSSIKDIDLQNLMNQFLIDNFHIKTRDQFLNDLFEWNRKFKNLMVLIQQTFCFRIKKNKTDIILKIYHNLNYKLNYDIPIEHFTSFCSFLSDKCFFSCDFSSNELKTLFSCVFEAKKDMNININMTELYFNLNLLTNTEIIEKSINVEEFFTFLFDKNSQLIILIIDSVEFNIQKKNHRIELSELNEKMVTNIDAPMLINSFFLMQNIEKKGYLLQKIAEMILSNFVNMQFGNNSQIASFFKNQSIQEFEVSKNSLYEKYISNYYFQNEAFEIDDDDFGEYFVLDGIRYEERSLICIEKTNQKYQNLDYFSGAFDDLFSLFLINSESVQSSKKIDFLLKLNSTPKSESYANIVDLSWNFEIFDLNETEYFIFHFTPDYKELKLVDSSSFTVSMNENIQNCTNCNSKSLLKSYLENNELYKQNLKLYFDELYKADDRITGYMNEEEISNFHTQKFSNKHLNLKVEHSNFHLIISQFIECESIDRKVSSIHKYDHLLCHQIEINYCNIKFLNLNFRIFKKIKLNNCLLESNLKFYTNIFSIMNLNLHFVNFQILEPIMIFDFVKIEPFQNINEFHLERVENHYILRIGNCKLTIFEIIPDYISHMKLTNCHLVITNEMNTSNIEHSEEQSIFEMHSLSEIMKYKICIISKSPTFKLIMNKCTSFDNIHISGVFNTIKIVNCTYLFIVKAECKLIEIENHKREFTLYSFLNKVISRHENSYLKIDDGMIHLKNLMIHDITDLHIKFFEIQNCEIKRIENVEAGIISIRDCKCSFQIDDFTELRKFHGETVNLYINRISHTTKLLYYDESDD